MLELAHLACGFGDRAGAREAYPDPRLILGPLYELEKYTIP